MKRKDKAKSIDSRSKSKTRIKLENESAAVITRKQEGQLRWINHQK